MNCKQAQLQIELGEAAARAHMAGCRDCAEYAALRSWSTGVLHSGRLEAQPPLMSSVWAAIHRASEQAWDAALRNSFRRLMPYMVATIAIVILVGSLSHFIRTPAAASEATAAAAPTPSPYAVVNGPDLPPVFGVMNGDRVQSTDEVLAGGH